jgi:tetratricopeptide (TPR) repeat protein
MKVILIATALSLTCLPPLYAGIYNSIDSSTYGPKDGQAMPFSAFRETVANLLSIPRAFPETPLRLRILQKSHELEQKLRAGTASASDLANLGSFYLRLNRNAEAIDILTRAVNEDRRPFMALANLGTAYQLENQPARALEFLRQARDAWPAHWPGISPSQLAWWRQVEDWQARLVRLRTEHRRSMGSQERLDDIFGIQFVAGNGRYEAGQLAASQKAKLPPDAVAIVQQLIIWLPADTRLYWLLGELLNAQGNRADAMEIFDECLWTRRYDAAELRAHRQVLQEARASERPLVLNDEPPSPSEAEHGWHVDKRTFLPVAVGAVLILILLAYLQIKEARRRRRTGIKARTEESTEEAH